jgi:hypothetical protein
VADDHAPAQAEDVAEGGGVLGERRDAEAVLVGGTSLSPWPGRSRLTTRWEAAKASASPVRSALLEHQPCSTSMGGRVGWAVSS